MMKRYEKLLILSLTLFAFGLRLWQLADVPPGWRDDELINSLVISQKVLDGDLQVYYADASGHEALYHALNALFLGLFGANILGIRLLSVFLGTLTVPLTWLLGRKLFGSTLGLLAAAALAVSFWSLMYSRIGLRHILMPVITLLAFIFFWRALSRRTAAYHLPLTDFVLAGIWLGIGFYVYFASRGLPLILLAFGVYLLLVARPLLKKMWPGMLLMFVVAALLALPLFITLSRQPESEARVDELAVPLIEARQGNFEPLQAHIIATLSMFHSDGDDEWLYNIPHRAVFGPLGAILFWLGVLSAVYYSLKPFALWLQNRWFKKQTDYPLLSTDDRALPSAFLLIWWLAGISPGFISVPPGSLGHTILAQPATFMLLALPLWRLGMSDNLKTGFTQRRKGAEKKENLPHPAASSGKVLPSLTLVIISLVLLISLAGRDFADYFGEWPQRGMVRFLYRAELSEIADYVNNDSQLTDFAVAGFLAGPWDKLALQMALGNNTAVAPRWFHPERAIFLEPSLSFTDYPVAPVAFQVDGTNTTIAQVGAYTLRQMDTAVSTEDAICFANGLCVIAAEYNPETGLLELTWWLARPLLLPPFQLISNPPPPGVDARPRLHLFAQLLAADGTFISGDDGLWVDAYSLQPGDIFRQQHHLPLPADLTAPQISFGLYDPQTGGRILTDDGRDHLTLECNYSGQSRNTECHKSNTEIQGEK